MNNNVVYINGVKTNAYRNNKVRVNFVKTALDNPKVDGIILYKAPKEETDYTDM